VAAPARKSLRRGSSPADEPAGFVDGPAPDAPDLDGPIESSDPDGPVDSALTDAMFFMGDSENILW
jgi:hypothetical protein